MASKKILTALAATLLVGASIALVAQDRSTPQARRGSAERSLVGISLFDPGTRVIARFGNPNEIQALTVGSTGIGPAGGGGGGGGAGGGPTGAGGGGGGGSRTETVDEGFRPELPPSIIGDPFSAGFSRQNAPGDGGGQLRMRGGASGGGGGGASAAGGGAASGSGESGLVTYTRWIYRRGSSRYAFILDKFNRVVQIEAVGLSDSRVKTRRGVTFGSTISTLINRYNAPDGYEISGSNMIVRYLTRDRVAFRMQKVDAKKPHVVTGIVVAAGR